MRKSFRFKQFEIYQDQTAMKVGTDGVLLGAWAELKQGKHVLDIGSGTGLISLMLAQRFTEALIDAVELDESAFNQTNENFLNSKYTDRLAVYQMPIQSYQTMKKYDLIVSNPPFFVNNERVELDARKTARQQETLTFDQLLKKTKELLAENGRASFIIPFDLEEQFVIIAKGLNLFPQRLVHIKGNANAPYKRSMIELGFHPTDPMISTLIIEVDRHQYTEDYIQLTKDFYLKM